MMRRAHAADSARAKFFWRAFTQSDKFQIFPSRRKPKELRPSAATMPVSKPR